MIFSRRATRILLLTSLFFALLFTPLLLVLLFPPGLWVLHLVLVFLLLLLGILRAARGLLAIRKDRPVVFRYRLSDENDGIPPD